MDKKINNIYPLSVDNLSVTYNEINILKNINFEINANEIVTLIGKSGVGKTTIIKAINGNIKYEGNIVSTDKKRTVYQEDYLFNWFNGYKNISIGVDGLKLEKKEIKERVLNVTQELDIIHLLKKHPYEMSGGEKKRVAIARAYISYPELILMDEPFSSLDIFTKEKMYVELLKIWENTNNSILFITHDIEEAILLSDRILIIKNQEISNEFFINFARPRLMNIKFSEKFIQLRKEISEIFYT